MTADSSEQLYELEPPKDGFVNDAVVIQDEESCDNQDDRDDYDDWDDNATALPQIHIIVHPDNREETATEEDVEQEEEEKEEGTVAELQSAKSLKTKGPSAATAAQCESQLQQQQQQQKQQELLLQVAAAEIHGWVAQLTWQATDWDFPSDPEKLAALVLQLQQQQQQAQQHWHLEALPGIAQLHKRNQSRLRSAWAQQLALSRCRLAAAQICAKRAAARSHCQQLADRCLADCEAKLQLVLRCSVRVSSDRDNDMEVLGRQLLKARVLLLDAEKAIDDCEASLSPFEMQLFRTRLRCLQLRASSQHSESEMPTMTLQQLRDELFEVLLQLVAKLHHLVPNRLHCMHVANAGLLCSVYAKVLEGLIKMCNDFTSCGCCQAPSNLSDCQYLLEQVQQLKPLVEQQQQLCELARELRHQLQRHVWQARCLQAQSRDARRLLGERLFNDLIGSVEFFLDDEDKEAGVSLQSLRSDALKVKDAVSATERDLFNVTASIEKLREDCPKTAVRCTRFRQQLQRRGRRLDKEMRAAFDHLPAE